MPLPKINGSLKNVLDEEYGRCAIRNSAMMFHMDLHHKPYIFSWENVSGWLWDCPFPTDFGAWEDTRATSLSAGSTWQHRLRLPSFASLSTQTPAPALFPYCCHSITSCSPGPTLLSLQSSWLKIVSAVFRHIAFKGGDGVSDKLSNTLKKQRNYFHAPQMRFEHEMTSSSSMFSL